MTTNQFSILMNEIKSLREQMTRIEERLREVEVVQATEEMARKVRIDLDTKAEVGLKWKLSVLFSNDLCQTSTSDSVNASHVGTRTMFFGVL